MDKGGAGAENKHFRLRNTDAYNCHRVTIAKKLNRDVVATGGSLVAHQTSGPKVPRFESGNSDNDPGALKDHCVML